MARFKLLAKICHRFFKPRVLRKLESERTIPPRLRVPAAESFICKLDYTGLHDNITDGLERALDTLGPEFFNPSDNVLIKINLNTSHSYPASTDPELLKALIKILREKGLTKIYVGDCSSLSALPTRKTARACGILKSIGSLAKFRPFDEEAWVRIKIQGQYLDGVTVPEIVESADKIISLSNLKTHSIAGFSCSLKNSVGFMHPLERYRLHQNNLSEKIAELYTAIQPDIVIVDARKVFVDGGPATGRTEDGNFILVGTDPVSVDIQAYKELIQLRKKHCKDTGSSSILPEDPINEPMFRHVSKISAVHKDSAAQQGRRPDNR